LLQLSGVGPDGLLREHGIDVVHELPGVGDNLQDHLGCRVIYKARRANTLNEISRGWVGQARTGLEYIFARRGALMMGAAPIGLFAKTREGLASPDVQYQFLAGSFDMPGKPMHPFPGCQLVAIPCRPESRGWLRIKSPDPRVAPAMQPNYLATRGDDHDRRESVRPDPRRAASASCSARQGGLAGRSEPRDQPVEISLLEPGRRHPVDDRARRRRVMACDRRGEQRARIVGGLVHG